MSALREHLQDLLTDVLHEPNCATVLHASVPPTPSWPYCNCLVGFIERALRDAPRVELAATHPTQEETK